jgi:hypothetical protein
MDKTGVEAKGKITRGIIICAILVVTYSFLGMPFDSFSSYYNKFRPSPQNLIFIRYLFSIALRLAVLISGIGILFRKHIFRKIIVFISFFTIATVYWKHPAICFKRVLLWRIAQGAVSADIIPRINILSWICVAICSIIDISVCLCLIYYLTRPKVREQFK